MQPYPSAADAVEVALETIARREGDIHAFAFLDADRARAEAQRAPGGPLHGLTLGVKDIFDTADQPTEYGSPIYAGHRPRADAAVVTQLRNAGAVAMGKTVTAELAWVTPGPTTNPHRATQTPGGSSSGSAAAVAAGMVDLALGTQTAGSVIRPASFCGVLGLKPTFGLVATAGVKPAAPSLDTVGLFATDFDVLELGFSVIASMPIPSATTPTFVLVPTDQWDGADADCRAVVEGAAAALDARRREYPHALAGLAVDQALVQAYEGARSLAWERAAHPELLSASLRQILESGDRISVAEYASVQRRAARARTPDALDALFGPADVIITPAAIGEAPGLASTGGPRFNRLWTLLGLPALSVPGAVGSTGLPIGVQLVARPYREDVLLVAGRVLAAALGERALPNR